jgi:prevent-host-death family protein
MVIWSGLVGFNQYRREGIMSEIGAYAAKTHLAELLERVRLGERFIITKHGEPIAELRPVSEHDSGRARRAVAEMRKLRRELAGRGVTLQKILGEHESTRDLAHAGHRT